MTLDQASEEIRNAVKKRLDATPADDPKMVGYKPAAESCCEGGRCQPRVIVECGSKKAVHPTSQSYFDLLDTLRDLHMSKSAGYGCPEGTDPLMNIRRGAEFVGIPAWKGAMVRLCDKVTRLAVFNKTGNLPHESVTDNLLDLASYSLLALLLYREDME